MLKELIDGIILEVVGPAGTGWKSAGTSRTVDVRGPGGARSRGSSAKSYPVGDMVRDPRERPELMDSTCSHEGTFVGLGIPIDVARFVAVPGGELPEDLHVTLFYRKGLTPEQVDHVLTIVRELSQGLPISGHLGGIGRFSASDSSDGRDVIYLSVDSPELSELRDYMAQRLREVGIDPQGDHGFTPHVTLAYVDPSSKTPFNRLKGKVPVTLSDMRFNPGSNVTEVKSKPKGIPHLEDLPPTEFMNWLRKYRDVELEGGLEVSEKVDGSAKMDFGVDGQGLWVKSKNGPKMYRSSAWGEKPMFRALRRAHAALEASGDRIRRGWPEGVAAVSSEVLYTKIPNSIEYGPNVIMIHGVHSSTGSPVPPNDAAAAAKSITSSVGGKLSALGDEWRFEYKPVISAADVMVDVKREFDTLGEVYEDLMASYPDRLKKAGKEVYKQHLDNFKRVQLAVKQKLVGQLRRMRSTYGPEGGDVEGVVFRDLQDDSLVKLVDKEYFTKLNKFLWHYREMLAKGAKIGDKWEPGVMQSLQNLVADDVFGLPVAKTPGFVNDVMKMAPSMEFPPNVDTPEMMVDMILMRYVREKKLMSGDYLTRFTKAVKTARKQFEILKKEWEGKKRRPQSFTVKDDEGRPIKRVKMDKLIIGRTDDAMEEMGQFFDGMDDAVRFISSIDDEDTRRVALLKLMLGEHRLKKMQQSLADMDVEDDDVQEALGDDLFGDDDAPTDSPGSKPIENLDPTVPAQARQILDKNAELLKKKKGIDVAGARQLGVGSQGTAFAVGSKVLKVTQDAKEASASMKIMGKGLQHVARIFDVFRFKDDMAYGVYQELLQEPSDNEKIEFDRMLVFTALPIWLKRASNWDQAEEMSLDFIVKKRGGGDAASEKGKWAIRTGEQFLDKLIKVYGMKDMWEELMANGIRFHDFQANNLMKRGGRFVLIDIGLSQVSGGGEPDVLESIDRMISEILREAQARSVGVTIGRFQPFHRGHAAIVRDLAKRFSKVIVIVAGNTSDKKNPFSYETRLELMKASLPDVMPKVEVHKAEWGGKGSGYIPGVISDLIRDGGSSVQQGTAINLLVGPDRVEGFKKQVADAAKYAEKLPGFDPTLVNVSALPGVKGDIDDDERISATAVRDALMKGDKATVAKMLDPHVVTDPNELDRIYDLLRKEIGVTEGPNDKTGAGASRGLDRVGKGAITQTLSLNKKSLKMDKGIDVSRLQELGSGQMGTAFDMGGGRVLKVTTDPDEARASNAIKGKTLANVVRIFDVFRFARTASEIPLYGIVQEKLNPLSEQEKQMVTRAFYFVDNNETLLSKMATGSWEEFENALDDELSRDVAEELGVDPESSETAMNKVKNNVQKRKTYIVTVLKHVGVPAMMKDLRNMRIQFADYHAGNIMKRGAKFVINDLGLSKSPGAEPDVLESLSQMLTDSLISELGGNTQGAPGSSVSMGGLGAYAAVGMRAQSSPWSSPSSVADQQVPDELDERENLSTIVSGKFIPWSEEARGLYEKVPPHLGGQKVGRGEWAFAVEMGGDENSVQGDRVSFDVEVDGQKWEVKQFAKDNKTGRYTNTIRPGTMGKGLEGINILRQVGQQLSKLNEIDEPTWVLMAKFLGDEKSVEHLRAFVQRDAPKIAQGIEISKGRVDGTFKGSKQPNRFGLKQAVQLLSKLFSGGSKEVTFSFIDPSTDQPIKKTVSLKKFLQLSAHLDLDPRAFGVSDDDIAQDFGMIGDMLVHPVFKNPDIVDEIWSSLDDPSAVFGHGAGVVIVTDHGYIPIKKQDYDKFLKFSSVSQGTAKFEVPNVGHRQIGK